MTTYRDLIAWQKSMELVEVVYTLSKEFPKEELYGLTSQIRRAAVSVPSNIAEGHGRGTPAEFAHFLSIAYGSLRELETQLIIAQRLKYIKIHQPAFDLCEETGRLLNGLKKSLKSS